MSRKRFIGTSEDAIRCEESKLERILPSSFSKWLLKNNGKSLGFCSIFPIFDSRDPRKTWYSISRNYKESWQEWKRNFYEDDEFDFNDENLNFSNLLPFAEFGTGDYYCFDYKRIGITGEPVIIQWLHETGEKIYLCEDFESFSKLSDRPFIERM